MSHIQLVALDLDGTLFNNQSVISQENLKTIRTITDAGIHVVISTGRPFNGVPVVQLEGTGIDYAILLEIGVPVAKVIPFPPVSSSK